MLFISSANETILKKVHIPSDGIELRLDLFPKINKEAIKNSKHTLMLTLRKPSQGGSFKGSEKERENLIIELLSLKPAFFDLEYDMDPVFLQKTIQNYPDTKFILSYHNFLNTPENLETLYEKMTAYRAYGYKLATLTTSSTDALRLLLFSKKNGDCRKQNKKQE